LRTGFLAERVFGDSTSPDPPPPEQQADAAMPPYDIGRQGRSRLAGGACCEPTSRDCSLRNTGPVKETAAGLTMGPHLV